MVLCLRRCIGSSGLSLWLQLQLGTQVYSDWQKPQSFFSLFQQCLLPLSQMTDPRALWEIGFFVFVWLIILFMYYDSAQLIYIQFISLITPSNSKCRFWAYIHKIWLNFTLPSGFPQAQNIRHRFSKSVNFEDICLIFQYFIHRNNRQWEPAAPPTRPRFPLTLLHNPNPLPPLPKLPLPHTGSQCLRHPNSQTIRRGCSNWLRTTPRSCSSPRACMLVLGTLMPNNSHSKWTERASRPPQQIQLFQEIFPSGK